MRRLLLVTTLALVWLPFLPGPAHALSAGGLIAAANAQRAAAGLPLLSLNGALSAAAGNKAADMIRNNYWSHVSPSGVGPWYWISAAGYPYQYAGENLAQGYLDDGSVMAAWMNSPEHRANVLGANYRDMGCGFASGVLLGTQTTVVTCDFGSTAAELAPPPLTAAPAVERISAAPASQVVAARDLQTATTNSQPESTPLSVPDYFRHSVIFCRPPDLSLAALIKGLLP